MVLKNIAKFIKELVLCICDDTNICPDCFNKSIWRYVERFVIYDENDEIVGYKDWSGVFNQVKICQECGFDEYSL